MSQTTTWYAVGTIDGLGSVILFGETTVKFLRIVTGGSAPSNGENATMLTLENPPPVMVSVVPPAAGRTDVESEVMSGTGAYANGTVPDVPATVLSETGVESPAGPGLGSPRVETWSAVPVPLSAATNGSNDEATPAGPKFTQLRVRTLSPVPRSVTRFPPFGSPTTLAPLGEVIDLSATDVA